MKLNRNIKIFINYFLGPLLFIWLSWSIYRQIMQQPDLEKAWNAIKASFHGPMLWNLVITLILMPNRFMKKKVVMTEAGMDKSTMPARIQLRKNP